MPNSLRQALTKRAQRLAWVYVTDNFVITPGDRLSAPKPAVKCWMTPITRENCGRVREFRDDPSRPDEYKRKVERNEMGLFAEGESGMLGSIWATVNHGSKPTVARGHMPLQPGEAVIHDIVTGERCRGKGIGAFMVERMAAVLIGERGVRKIFVDVNFRNRASLRMMERVGAPKFDRVFYLSMFGGLALSKVLRRYPC